MRRVAFAVLLFCAPFCGQTQSSEAPAKHEINPKTFSYNTRLIARGVGNVGIWWSFMNENDKAAFIDGFQEGMGQANEIQHSTCEAIRQMTDSNTALPQFAEIAFVCTQQSETADYEKVTLKDVDDFYAELLNQEIPVRLSMGWLRDKARGSKTRGQLIDALDQYREIFKVSQNK